MSFLEVNKVNDNTYNVNVNDELFSKTKECLDSLSGVNKMLSLVCEIDINEQLSLYIMCTEFYKKEKNNIKDNTTYKVIFKNNETTHNVTLRNNTNLEQKVLNGLNYGYTIK